MIDRSELIKIAAHLSVNNELRTALLRTARQFPTQEALDKYLNEHPKADETKHSVTESKSKSEDKSSDKSEEKATVQELKPQHKEEIKEYKMDIVGDSAPQAVEIARKIKDGIDKAADICKMSPSVCQGNKGLTRDKMPQIEGEKSVKDMLASDKPDEVAKGKAMVQAGADPKSDKTVLGMLLDHLSENGIKTKEMKMPVGKMKATQSEIKAQKVFGMADAFLKGKFPNIDDSVVVSKDGHILDGHHRWAALLTVDPGRKMKVKQIDMTMDDLLKEAAAFPGVYKADFAGSPLHEDEQKKYKESNKSSFKKKGSSGGPVYVDFEGKLGEKPSFTGTFFMENSEVMGYAAVRNLAFSVNGDMNITDFAGNLVITESAPFASASIISLKSIRVGVGSKVVPTLPNKIVVTGTLEVFSDGKKKKVKFKGHFVPSSYMRDDWNVLRRNSSRSSLIRQASLLNKDDQMRKLILEQLSVQTA